MQAEWGSVRSGTYKAATNKSSTLILNSLNPIARNLKGISVKQPEENHKLQEV